LLDGSEGMDGEGRTIAGRDRREEGGEGRRLLGGGEVSGEDWDGGEGDGGRSEDR
jgi:hypothetical protein